MCKVLHIKGDPQKCPCFSLAITFTKKKETFKIFSPQLLEVYRILLMETILESIMFYYTFSVINTMFVPCTALLNDSTAATRTLKLFTILLSISCGINLISLLIIALSCLWIVFTNSAFQVFPQKIVRRVEILGDRGLRWNESVPWEVLLEVFNCSVLFEKWGATLFLEQNAWIPPA